MNKRFSLFALCAALTMVNGAAAERPATFPVSERQMQALGIEVAPLRASADPVVLTLPAQVVVPVDREHIVSAPLAGLAARVFVQPNQVVKQGTPLVRVTAPELGTMQLQLVQATTRAKLARETAQREQALFDEGIIAARRVQEAQAGLAEGEAALRVAQGSLRMAGMSAGAISRVAASGKPEDGVTLTAARAGIITEINVKPGQRVEPGFALMHLAQLDQLALEIQAPAGRASEWRVGSKLKLQGRPGGATITSISPIVAAGSQTSALRAEVWRGSGLRPGEFVTVELPLAHHATAFDVPLRALAYERDKTVVFVRTAGGFEARPVIVQSSAGQMARVEGRLAAGERIAVSGVIALKGSWLGEKGGE